MQKLTKEISIMEILKELPIGLIAAVGSHFEKMTLEDRTACGDKKSEKKLTKKEQIQIAQKKHWDDLAKYETGFSNS